VTTLNEANPERIKLESGLARLELDVSPKAIDDLLSFMALAMAG
jgi:hypothetical protein